MKALQDHRDEWEQQQGETSRGFHAFAHYRDLGHDRSVARAFQEHQDRCSGVGCRSVDDPPPRKRGARLAGGRRAPRLWWEWSSKFSWVARAEVWDARQDKSARERIAKDQLDARVRHARMANASLQALTVPSRAILTALQNPTVMQRLVEESRTSTNGLIKLIDLATWAAKAIPGLVAVERLALGMTTEAIEVQDRREDALAEKIVGDAVATELAIALLDRLAGTDIA